jgi:hypothetical protein
MGFARRGDRKNLTFPRARVPDEWEQKIRKWATDLANNPNLVSDATRAMSFYADSSKRFNVWYNGKMCEAAIMVYYGIPLETLQFKPDFFDVPLGPIRIDSKGTENTAAVLLLYSVTRLARIPYSDSSNKFTHLLMVRSTETPQVYELCGWMTKEEFELRKLVAPEAPEGNAELIEKAAALVKGTWYVPVEWLHPVEQLRCYRDPYFDEEGRFIHYCQYPLCGAEAPYGTGFFPRAGKLGVHRCATHKRPSMFVEQQ